MSKQTTKQAVSPGLGRDLADLREAIVTLEHCCDPANHCASDTYETVFRNIKEAGIAIEDAARLVRRRVE